MVNKSKRAVGAVWTQDSVVREKIMQNSSGEMQARNKEKSEALLELHFPPQGPQTVACAEDSNGAGKRTGPRSLEEHL